MTEKKRKSVSVIKKIWRVYLRIYRNLISAVSNKVDQLLDCGFFGYYLKVCHYLKICVFAGLIPPNKEMKEALKEIEASYDEIRPHSLMKGEFNRLGEFVPRYNIFASEGKNHLSAKILDVLCFSPEKREVNQRMVAVMRRNYTLIMDEDKRKWFYILRKSHKVCFDYEKQYIVRKGYTTLMDYQTTCSLWQLTEEEKTEGTNKLKEMGVWGDFVCFSNRDNKYLRETVGDFFQYHDYRNSNIKTRREMSDYLGSCGIQTVRMGKYPGTPCDMPNVIDYSAKHYDELMDLYLAYRCLFFVSDDSGVNSFAFSYGKPQIFTNDVADLGGNCSGYQGFPQRDDNLLIFKKIWSRKEERYLTFVEILDAQYEIGGDGNRADEKGLVFIENSEEEILDVVKEMYEHLVEKKSYSQKEEDIQRRAKEILNNRYEMHGLQGSERYIGRLGTEFLIKNREILGL